MTKKAEAKCTILLDPWELNDTHRLKIIKLEVLIETFLEEWLNTYLEATTNDHLIKDSLYYKIFGKETENK